MRTITEHEMSRRQKMAAAKCDLTVIMCGHFGISVLIVVSRSFSSSGVECDPRSRERLSTVENGASFRA